MSDKPRNEAEVANKQMQRARQAKPSRGVSADFLSRRHVAGTGAAISGDHSRSETEESLKRDSAKDD